jgi:hypothetical protein
VLALLFSLPWITTGGAATLALETDSAHLPLERSLRLSWQLGR